MPQRVDPFIPVSQPPRPKTAQLRGQYGQHLFGSAVTAPKVVRRHSGSVDGLKRGATPVPQQASTQAHTVPHSVSSKPKNRVKHMPKSPQRRHSRIDRLWQKLQLPALILAAIAVGLLVQSQLIGELAIGAYAIFALVRRVASRTTFLLALLSVLCIVVLLVVRSNNTLAATFAIYAFLLMVVGTITLGREIRQEG